MRDGEGEKTFADALGHLLRGHGCCWHAVGCGSQQVWGGARAAFQL
jgi:hypothetical protein